MTIEVKRGRVFDPGTRRWYRDGFAPFQLPDMLPAWCGRCGRESAVITRRGTYCVHCSPVLKGD